MENKLKGKKNIGILMNLVEYDDNEDPDEQEVIYKFGAQISTNNLNTSVDFLKFAMKQIEFDLKLKFKEFGLIKEDKKNDKP